MAAKERKTEPREQSSLHGAGDDNLEQLQDMDVEVSIELGRSKITLDAALELGEQSLIELDKVVGEPVDIRLNGKLFARGEVVTVAENFGVRMIHVVEQSESREG